MIPPPPLPRYGQAALADLTPSIVAALGVPGPANVLGIDSCRRIAMLVVDGLGWELLRGHAVDAPFLSSLVPAARSLTAGFPSTTAASVASLGLGLPPGEHGLMGYTMLLPGHSRAMNLLRWAVYGQQHGASGQRNDLLTKIPPERLQPKPSMLEAACSGGVDVVLVGPAEHEKSGLSRASLRAGRFRSLVSAGDLVAGILEGLRAGDRQFVYGHYNELDSTGHARGVGSLSWRFTLRQIDRLCQTLAENLPAGSTLIITGDHGMVDLQPDQRLDIDDHRELAAGVRVMAGEGRARYLYTESGAQADVLAAWRETLGDRMWVVSREEAVDSGWFGPRVPDDIRARIGDVVAAAYGPVGVFQRAIDPGQAGMAGHHGSLTAQEQLVPMITIRN